MRGVSLDLTSPTGVCLSQSNGGGGEKQKESSKSAFSPLIHIPRPEYTYTQLLDQIITAYFEVYFGASVLTAA